MIPFYKQIVVSVKSQVLIPAQLYIHFPMLLNLLDNCT